MHLLQYGLKHTGPVATTSICELIRIDCNPGLDPVHDIRTADRFLSFPVKLTNLNSSPISSACSFSHAMQGSIQIIRLQFFKLLCKQLLVPFFA